MSVSLGILALALGAFLEWKPIGPDGVAKRVAAVLIVGGASALVTGISVHGKTLGTMFQGWETKGAADAASIFKGLGPDAVKAVEHDLPIIVFGILTVLWVAAMLTSRLASRGGRIFATEFNSVTLWGGGLVIALFAAGLPGGLGSIGSTARDTSVSITSSIAGAVFG